MTELYLDLLELLKKAHAQLPPDEVTEMFEKVYRMALAMQFKGEK